MLREHCILSLWKHYENVTRVQLVFMSKASEKKCINKVFINILRTQDLITFIERSINVTGRTLAKILRMFPVNNVKRRL